MSGHERRTVLIVEDQAALADAYTGLLSAEYETRTATGGGEALEKIDDSVGAVLLDRRMPGMSGDEVLAAFAERGVGANVAMLTAVEPDVDIVDIPFDEYVTKPVVNEELLALVEGLLERHEYDEPIQQLLGLAAKTSLLEAADLDHTAEYDRLAGRLYELRRSVDTPLDEIDSTVDPRGRLEQ